MRRRRFIEMTASMVGTGVIAGCGSRFTNGIPSTAAAGDGQPMDAKAFHATRRFVETRFGRIAYVERGTGDAALFLHGYPLNGFQWRGALDRLSAHRRCIAADFLGLGYTVTSEEQDLSPQAQTDMLAAFLDALSIEAVDLIANDSGGAIGQLFAVQHSERTRTMLLTNCDVHENSPPAKLQTFIEQARAGLAADQWLAPQLADKSVARSDKGLGGAAYMNPESLTDEAIDCYFTPLLSSPLRKAQFNQYAVALEPNPLVAIEPALKRSAVPTRIVWGTNDDLFDVSWARWLDRTLPQSRGVRLVEGGKLFFPEEVPDLIAAEARQLWGVA
jgi:haloalkane dehalogenase